MPFHFLWRAVTEYELQLVLQGCFFEQMLVLLRDEWILADIFDAPWSRKLHGSRTFSDYLPVASTKQQE